MVEMFLFFLKRQNNLFDTCVSKRRVIFDKKVIDENIVSKKYTPNICKVQRNRGFRRSELLRYAG